jgi:ABC-type sugar transport system permease subunit
MHRRKDNRPAILFLGPFAILLIAFQYVPLVTMFVNSTRTYNLLSPSKWTFVGLDNFTRILADPTALHSLVVTATFTIGLVLVELPLGLLLAVFINRKIRGIALLRGSIFAPVVTSVVVVATMWTFMLDPTHGLINNALAVLHLGPFQFTTSESQALPSLLAMTIWEQVGFSMVLFLAGLQTIPPDYYDAAAVDGAGSVGQFRHITVPLLRRTIVLVVIVMTTFAFQTFAPAYIMTQGGPNYSTQFFVFEIYQQAFSFLDPGYASALSVVLIGAILLVAAIQMRLLRTRWDY